MTDQEKQGDFAADQRAADQWTLGEWTPDHMLTLVKAFTNSIDPKRILS
jgi:hypothetical protein